MRFFQKSFSPIFWACLLLITAARAAAQSPADSLIALLPGLPEQAQVAFINTHFYTFYTDNYDRALTLGEKALRISEKNKWPELGALTLNNLGVVHYLKGNYERALGFYQRSLDRYEQLADRKGQSAVLKEMGNYFKKIKEYDRALLLLQRAVRLCTEAKDYNGLTGILDIQGSTLLEMGKLEAAEAIFQQEKSLLEQTGDENGLSYTLDNLAALATERGLYEQAIAYLATSTDIRRRLGDKQGIAISVNNTGETLLRAGRPAQALPKFLDALQQTETIGLADLRRHIMQMLSDTYAAMGRPAEAMQWQQRSYALKDSLFNIERSRQLAEMAEKYEAEKKEKILARQQAQLGRRNALLLLSGFGLAALAIIFVIVFRQQKMKQLQLRREAAWKEERAQAEISKRLQNERLRIARDLHDNLGAELTIISSVLSKKAFQAASETEKKELEAVGSSARQAMNQLRETIWATRAEQFTLRQLADKIGDFAARATACPVEIDTPPGDVQLSPSQTLNLYRIVQEAVTNAGKHAGASHIRVGFKFDFNKNLTLTVADNGSGFDPSGHFSGNGLANMQARAEELGGKIAIESGHGTTLTAVFPLDLPGNHT